MNSRPLDPQPIATPHYYGVKEAVFPFNMFPEVDPVLAPEMRSTGEVLGLARDFGTAFYQAQKATKTTLPLAGSVFISISDAYKKEAAALGSRFVALGFSVLATQGTHALLQKNGIPCALCQKLTQGHPHLLNFIEKGQVDIIVNTPVGKQSALDDSYIRKAAIGAKIFYVTTIEAAKATVQAIEAMQKNPHPELLSLQEYHQ